MKPVAWLYDANSPWGYRTVASMERPHPNWGFNIEPLVRASDAEATVSALKDRVAVLEEALKPFADLGTKEGRRGRLAFEDTDEDQDVVSTKGDTFDEVSDARQVCLLIEAGHVRRARAALTPGGENAKS